MFICNTCLSSFTNPESGFKSRGPCKVCGQVGLCNEIPSKYLEARPSEPQWDVKVLEQRIKDLRSMGYLPLEQI